MPSNIITINGSDDHEWVVPDSEMDELLKWLEQHGWKAQDQSEAPCQVVK